MKKLILAGFVIALSANSAVSAERDLKASESELDVLSGEANETRMKEETPETPVASEPAVTPSADLDVDALSDSVARQLSGILGAPDAEDEAKTEAKLEGMVSSALLSGVKMDELRSAVNEAMEDVTASEPGGVTAEKVKKAKKSLKKLVGKGNADKDYIDQLDKEANALLSSTSSTNDKNETTTKVSASTASASENTVVVQAGESLYKIALRVYGSGDNYLRLYEANRDQVIDPNLIRVGQVLRVPK